MKYLVIAALSALFALLLYSRLYPYIQAFKKLLTAAKTFTEPGPNSNRATTQPKGVGSKLVRCVGCGTWVPAARAVGANVGSSVYCSRECLAKKAERGKEKLAG